MEAKHTQGPWRLYGYDVGTAQDETLAVVCAMDGDTDEANARLIAAAPDLLAALEDIVQASDANDGNSLMHAIQAAQTIIAKARGK